MTKGGLFLALCCVIHAVDAQTLMVRLKTSALNDFVQKFKASILPKVVGGMPANTRDGTHVSGFSLPDVNALSASIKTYETSTASARVEVNIGNTKVNVATVRKEGPSVSWLGIHCTLHFRAEIKVPTIALVFDLTIPDPDASQLLVSLVDARISGTDVELYTQGSGVCGWGISNLVEAADSMVGRMAEEKLLEGVRSQLQSLSANLLPLTQSKSVAVMEDQILIGSIQPALRMERISSSNTAITLAVTTSLAASLHNPSWRAGTSYNPTISSAISLPQEEKFDLHMMMTFDGINAALSSVWYVLWATIPDDPTSMTSSLCQATTDEVCPFPPITTKIRIRTLAYATLFTVFPKYTKFELEAVVDPPSMSYSPDGAFTGTGSGRLLILGSNRRKSKVQLAQFNLKMTLDMANPTLNANTGLLEDFDIQDLDVKTFQVDLLDDVTRRAQLRELRLRRLFRWAARILNDKVDSILPQVNAGMQRVLQQVPLQLPALNNFPVPGQVTNIFRNNTKFGGVSSGGVGLGGLRFGGAAPGMEMASDIYVTVNDMKSV